VEISLQSSRYVFETSTTCLPTEGLGVYCRDDDAEVAGLLEPPAEDVVDAVTDENTDVVELKQRLIDSLYGTQRGLRASSDTRAEVIELITQLEAKNPTPAPTEALTLLNGKWILAYVFFTLFNFCTFS
jgi:hypothetical protein